jgi:hypothetical protein
VHGTLTGVPEPRLRSPVARAVVPVLAGMAVIAAVFGVLWLTAVAITHHARDVQTRPGSDLFVVGRVDRLVDSVSANGPILLPDLVGPAGRRPVGLAHEGTTDFDGWRVFSLRPAGNAADCLVALDRTTKQLTDCNGRVYSPSELPPADRVEVLVNRDNGTLSLDLNPGSS